MRFRGLGFRVSRVRGAGLQGLEFGPSSEPLLHQELARSRAQMAQSLKYN